MEHLNRYRCVWNVSRFLFGPWLKRKFNYTPEICEAEGPLLVLANHNTDWDPLLLALAFPKYMSFVASEHIFRWGVAAKAIIFLLNPIARLKGTTAGDTAMTMLRRIKKGVNVAMFAEGNRSFDGLTGTILPATGKLARSSGATLVTYRFDGGYFTCPRWAGSSLRRGKLTGRVMNVYSPEQLKSMSPAEVNAAIRRDLFVDAYAVQREWMVPFKGKNLAEHLETVLCRCPKCGKLDTMRSAGNTLSCVCGFSVKYNEYGFFEGNDAPFDNVTEWDRYQSEQLCAFADTICDNTTPIFSDENMILQEIMPDHDSSMLGTGTLTLFSDRLECCGRVFPLLSLGGFMLHGPQTIDLSLDGRSYEISCQQIRCTRKYMTVIEHLRASVSPSGTTAT